MTGCIENTEFQAEEVEVMEKKEQEKKEQKKDKFMKRIFYTAYSPKLYDEFTDDLLDYAKKLPKNWIALDEVGGI